MTLSTSDVDYKRWKRSVADFLQAAGMTQGAGGRKVDEGFSGRDDSLVNADLLATMNVAQNANEYIKTTVMNEQARVNGLEDGAKRDLYRIRQHSLQTTYVADMCAFLAMLVRVLIFAAMLILGILVAHRVELLSTRLATVTSIAVASAAGVLTVTLLYAAAGRRKDAWGHFYWYDKTTAQSAAAT